MQIGELSRRSGVSQRMLRYYEQQGLLRPARTEAGYRDFGEAELQAALRIRLLSASGLKLDAIQVLLPCMVDGPGVFDACDPIRATLQQELARLDHHLHALAESRRIVASYLEGLEERPASRP
ncbi:MULTISPECIES: MerR family transcriptional regulator [unclassified Acidovorax]|uniref:MerR family transcriptional regulator n=1 Tax=unclassified Acidovorax TaxID=2684926 RepID=UPI00288318F5|nr:MULTISPECIES: MerR family transcriptional regulator [unclassified Acidovorax]